LPQKNIARHSVISLEFSQISAELKMAMTDGPNRYLADYSATPVQHHFSPYSDNGG